MNKNFIKGFEKKAFGGTALKMLGGPIGAAFLGWTGYDVIKRTQKAVTKPKGMMNVPDSFYGVKAP